jgi:hypothetical protein
MQTVTEQCDRPVIGQRTCASPETIVNNVSLDTGLHRFQAPPCYALRSRHTLAPLRHPHCRHAGDRRAGSGASTDASLRLGAARGPHRRISAPSTGTAACASLSLPVRHLLAAAAFQRRGDSASATAAASARQGTRVRRHKAPVHSASSVSRMGGGSASVSATVGSATGGGSSVGVGAGH